MERLTIEVGSFEVNCSILSDAGAAWIVDPGQDGARILALLAKRGLEPKGILLTHAHFDHISGIPALQAAYPRLPVFVHDADRPMFGHPLNQMSEEYASIGVPANLCRVEALPERLPGLQAIHTPGHTPGGICYYFAADKLLLSGDTLFAGSCGRTDFPGGSMSQMTASLRRLATLPGDTLVIPGHGMHTTIARERDGNPYMV
ncbi:MAG: MBL fold metallo-hydrolase [Kiritimatiellia bacterium]